MIKQLQTGDLLNNERYRIEANYREGGQSFIYLATNLISNESVIIKQNKENHRDYINAIDQEKKVLLSLEHPLLPKVYDFFEDSGFTFLVMSRIVGEDLNSLVINNLISINDTEIIGWIAQLLNILNYLQELNPPLIHGDIKPDNIRLGLDGNIYLLDFGTTTRKGNKNDFVIGQSNYSSPEQFKDMELTPQSDVYSLGATAYYLLTKIPPKNALFREKAILKGLPDPLTPITQINSEVSYKLANLIETALSLDPALRPKDAEDMYAQLQIIWETNIFSRSDEIETLVVPRNSSTKIIFDLSSNTEQPSSKIENSYLSPIADFIKQDATLEALQIMQLIDENSPIIKEVADIVTRVIDAPLSQRREKAKKYEARLMDFSSKDVLVINNFISKLVDHSVCDVEIQQKLRAKLGQVNISRSFEQIQKGDTEPVINLNEKIEIIKKINYQLLIWIIRGVLASIPISILLCWICFESLINIPTSVFLIIFIISGFSGLIVFFILTRSENRKKFLRKFSSLEWKIYTASFIWGMLLGVMIVLMIFRTISII